MMDLQKRALDVVLALFGLILLFPLFVAIAAVIRGTSEGPVLYRSRRLGRYGWPFLMLKFRSMQTDEAVPGLVTLDDDPRITTVGRWLRRHKLDELPQLWNVLKGEMTLVGPRPQIPALVLRYTPEQRKALEALPGITDPASLRFWNEGALLRGASEPDKAYLSQILPEKLRLSLGYLEGRTFVSDVKVLCETGLACFGLGQQERMARPSAATTFS